MAKSLEEILSQAAKGSKNIDTLTKSIKELTAAKKSFLVSGDPKSILAIQKMIKAIEALIKITGKYDSQLQILHKAQEENRDLNEEEIRSLEKVIKARDKAEENAQRVHNSFVRNAEEKKKYNEQFEADAIRYFRTYTTMGKAYSGITDAIGKYTANLTFASLAQKAWNRHIQSAEIQQNILIQSYKGFRLEQDKSIESTDKYGKSVSQLSDKQKKGIHETIAYTKATLDLSTAIARTEATAQRMGVSTEVVGDAFTKFARITGSRNADVLKTLSEGAITVSRAMGITVPEAIDFVSTRMDKFGGSASSAIASMYSMQKAAENTNKEFGRTVIRGDDVVRTIQDISKQTTIYGIDQRFVGNILRENVARLQSTGKSYEAAQRQAKAFTEAVTGKAPEWMQVYAAFDVSDQLVKNFNGKELNAGMKSELEAAKPGLSAEVEKLLRESGGKLTYSVKRALGEMTSGTTVGIGAMNKQILKLAKHPEGLVLISKQFGVSLSDAVGMVDAAKALEQKQIAISKITGKNADYAKFTYKVGEKDIKLNDLQIKQMKEIDASNDSETDKIAKKKELLESIYQQKSDELTVEKDMQRLKAEEENNLKQIEKINKYITDAQKKKAEFQKKLKENITDKERAELEREVARIDKMIAGKELEKSRYESKTEEEKGRAAGLKTVEDINKELLNEFGDYADTTGKSLKAMVTELSDTKNLLMAAGIVGLTRWLLHHTGIVSRIEKHLALKSIGKEDLPKPGDKDVTGPKSPKTPTPKPGDKDFVGPVKQKDSALSKVGELFKYKEGKFDAKIQEHALAFSAGSALASQAMDRLTAKYDASGKLIEDVNSQTAKTLKSFSQEVSLAGGMLAQMPGKLGKLGGAVGAVTAAWEVGVTVGQGLNAVFEKLGLTGESTAQWFADLSAKDGPLGKFLKWTAGVEDNSGGQKKADEKLISSLVRKGLTEKEARTAMAEADKQNMGVIKYLEKTGKLTPGKDDKKALPTTTPPKPGTVSALTGAKIPPNVAKKIGSTPEQTTSAETPVVQAAETPSTPATGATGSFVGGPQADGSITLKIENFMNAFAQA